MEYSKVPIIQVLNIYDSFNMSLKNLKYYQAVIFSVYVIYILKKNLLPEIVIRMKQIYSPGGISAGDIIVWGLNLEA